MIYLLQIILRIRCSIIGIPDQYPTLDLTQTISQKYYGTISLYSPLRPQVTLGSVLSDQSNSSFLFQVYFSNNQRLLAYCEYSLNQWKIIHYFKLFSDNKISQQYSFEVDFKGYEGQLTFHYFLYKKDQSMLILSVSNNNVVQNITLQNFVLDSTQKQHFIIGGSLSEFGLANFPGYLQFALGESKAYEKSYYQNLLVKCKLQKQATFDPLFSVSFKYQLLFPVPLVYFDYSLQFWNRIKNLQFQQGGLIELFQINQQQRKSSEVEMGQDAFRLEFNFISPDQSEIYVYYYSYEFPAINVNKDYVLTMTKRKYIGKIENVVLYPELQKLAFRSEEIRQFSFSQFQFVVGKGSNINYEAEIAYLQFYNCYNELTEQFACHFSCQTCDGPFAYNCLSCPSSSGRILNKNEQTCHCAPWKLEQNITQCFEQDLLFEYQMLSNVEGYDKISPEIICSYSYFLYANKCYKCPSSGNKFRKCYQCLLDWKNWVRTGECYDEYQIKQIFLMVDEELQSCDYCQTICYSLSDDCQKYRKNHLNKITFVKCQNYYDYKNQLCLPPISFYQNAIQKISSTNNNCNSRCVDCQNQNFCNQCKENSDALLLNLRDCQKCTINNCLHCFSYTYIDGKPISTLQSNNLIAFEITDDFFIGCAECEEGYYFDQSKQLCLSKFLVNDCDNYYFNRDDVLVCLSTKLKNFFVGIEIESCNDLIQFCHRCIKYTTEKIICSKCETGYYINYQLMCDACPVNSDYCNIERNGQEWVLQIQPFYISFYQFTQYFALNSLQSGLQVYCLPDYHFTLSSCLEVQKSLYCSKYQQQKCISCSTFNDYTYPINKFKYQCFQCFHQCQYCIPKGVDGTMVYYSLFGFSNYNWYSTKCIQTDNSNYIEQESGLVRPIQQQIHRYKIIYQIKQNISIYNEFTELVTAHLNIIQPQDILIDLSKIGEIYSQFQNKYYQQIHNLKNVNLTLNNQVFNQSLHLIDFNSIIFENLTFQNNQESKFNLLLESQFGVDIQFLNITINFDKQLSQFYEFYLKVFNCSNFYINYLQFNNFHGSIRNFFELNLGINSSTSLIHIQNIVLINCSIQNGILFNFVSLNDKYIDLQIKNITLQNCTFNNFTFFQLSDLIMQLQFQVLGLILLASKIDNNLFIKHPKSQSEVFIQDIYFKNSSLSNTQLFFFNLDFNCNNITFEYCTLINSDIFILSDTQAKNKLTVSNINISFLKLFQSSLMIMIQEFEVVTFFNFKVANSGYQIYDIFEKSIFNFKANSIFVQNYSAENTFLNHLQINSSKYLQVNVGRFDNSNFKQKLAHTTAFDSQIQGSQFLYCINVLKVFITNLQVKSLFIKNQIFIQIAELSQVVDLQIIDSKFTNMSIIQTKKLSITSLIGILLQQSSTIFLQCIQFQTIFGLQRLDNQLFDQIQLLFIQSDLSKVTVIDFFIQNNFIANSSTALIAISSYSLKISNFTNINSNILTNLIYEKLLDEYFQIPLLTLSIIFQIQSYGSLFKIKCANLEIDQLTTLNSSAQTGGLAYIVLIQGGYFSFQNSTINNSYTNENANSLGGAFYIDSKFGNLNLRIQNINVINCYSFNSGGFLFLQPSIIQNYILIQNVKFYGVISITRSILSTEFVNNGEKNLIVLKNILIICEDSNYIKFSNYFPFFELHKINPNLDQEGMLFLKYCNLILSNLLISIQTLYEPALVIYSDSLLKIKKLSIQIQFQTSSYTLKIQGPYLSKKFQLYISDLDIFQSKQQDNQQFFLENYHCEQLNFKEEKMKTLFIQVPNHLDNNCLLHFWISTNNNIISLIEIQSVSEKQHTISFENIVIKSIMNSKYKANIVNIVTKGQLILIMKLITLLNCDCNEQSCISVTSQTYQQSKIVVNQSKFIKNFNAANGTVQMKQVDQFVFNSLFINNTGENIGGALFLESKLVQNIQNTYFFDNSALNFGGAVFSYQLDPKVTNNYFFSNFANQGMQSLGFLPQELQVVVVEKNKRSLLQQSANQFSPLRFPSGQSLENYMVFNKKSLIYEQIDQQFLIIVTNSFKEKQILFNLSQNCLMEYSFVFENRSILNNQSYKLHLSFNDQYEINLNEIIIVKNPYEKTLMKSIIFCPQILQRNSSIEFYIKTYKCQLGEILFEDQCLKCNGNQGYFSFDPTIGSCIKINTNEIKNNTENLLELYQGYWRPQIFSSKIAQCHNNLVNCLGGWEAGDITCYLGQIGALCEECDLYNIRGNGNYSSSKKYECSKCGSLQIIFIKLMIMSIWVIFQINLAVKNTQMQNEKFLMLKTLSKHYIILFKNYQEQTGTLFKLIINYFQIINLFSIVSSSFDFKFGSIFAFVGNSAYSISYDLDCLLHQELSINIMYANSFYVIFMSSVHFCSYFLISYFLSVLGLGIFSEESIYCSLFYLTLTTKGNYVNQLILLAFPRKISEIEWISSNVSYEFHTIKHYNMLWVYILPALIVFSIIIPVILIIFFKQNKSFLTYYRFKRKFGYLSNDYQTHSYYWELIKLQKKEIMMLFFVMFQDIITLGLLFQIFLLYFYQKVFLIRKPYSLEPLNKFEKKLLETIQTLLFFSLFQDLAENLKENIYLISKICKTIILFILIAISVQKLVTNLQINIIKLSTL